MSVPLRIAERTVDGLVVLHLEGHLVFDESDRMLRERVASLVDAGAQLLLIDLHDVSYIDSGGIGALVQISLDVAKRGGQLALLCPSTCVNRVLQRTHVAAAFEIFQDEAQALRSMTVAPPHQPGAVGSRGFRL